MSAATPIKATRKGLVQLLLTLPRTSPRLTALLLLVVGVATAIPTLFMIASGTLIGGIPAAARAGAGSPEASRLMTLAMLAAGLFCAQQVLPALQTQVTEILGRRVDNALASRVARAALAPSGMAHLEDAATLDRVSLAMGIGTGSTAGAAVQGLVMTSVVRVRALAAAALVGVYYRWWLAIALALFSVGMKSALKGPVRTVVDAMMGQTQVMRRVAYFRDLALAPLAAKELRIFGLGRWVLERHRTMWRDAMRIVWAERRRSNVRVVQIMFGFMLAGVIPWAIVARAAALGQIDLAALAILSEALGHALSLTLGPELQIEAGAAAMPHVDELERVTATPVAGTRMPDRGTPRERIRFEDVGFRYRGRDEDVFEHLDLEIPAGRSLAVVGRNGAGKTTLAKLLARQYDPTSGRITIDDVDLRDLDAHAWQRHVGAIFQDFVRYQLPASANVGYGAIERLGDLEALRVAAERAGALETIDGLGQGWDTVLSRQYTDGVELSGGQWQRVALARALFAVSGGATVLVLDEPTAALDVRSELALFDRFLELTRGVTTVLVSHRFSTVRRADRIAVLERGRVVEQGSHDELVAAGGRYAEMFTLQAARFAETPWTEEAAVDA